MPGKAKAARKRAAVRGRKKSHPRTLTQRPPKPSGKARRKKASPRTSAARPARKRRTLRTLCAELLVLLRDVRDALSEPAPAVRMEKGRRSRRSG